MVASSTDKKSLLILLSVLTFVIGGTFLISVLARGYQINFFNFKNGSIITSSGLLSATSRPKGASVYIDNRLQTATDDTLNLPPGDYQVKIVKDGYLPWEKTVSIKKEVVFQTDSQLFRSTPDLKPITLTGAINPALSPDETKIAYAVASASAAKDNGLYVFELSSTPIPLGRDAPRQLATNFPGIDWSKYTFVFSPNSRQILASNAVSGVSYLLSLDQPVTLANLIDVTPRLSLIQADWQAQEKTIINNSLEEIPLPIKSLVSTDSSKHFDINSTGDKILYLASRDGQIPDHIIPAPPAQSTQKQDRSIKKDNYYVYDVKDDTNFLIGSKQDIQNPSWLPASNSILFTQGDAIMVIEYDATNKSTLFAGNFNHDIVFPWTDGSRIVTLTSPWNGAQENLYSITIR